MHVATIYVCHCKNHNGNNKSCPQHTSNPIWALDKSSDNNGKKTINMITMKEMQGTKVMTALMIMPVQQTVMRV